MKKVIVLVSVLFMLLPLNVYAHSKMTTSSPGSNEVLTESPEQISLTFNTTISSVSTFTLVDADGNDQPVDNISVNNDTISGSVPNQLASGSYTVEWNIIGEDGHAVNGFYSFELEVAEVEQPTSSPEESTVPETTNEAEASEDTEQNNETELSSPEPSVVEQESQQPEQENSTNSQPIWPYIVIGVIVIAILAVALRKRK